MLVLCRCEYGFAVFVIGAFKNMIVYRIAKAKVQPLVTVFVGAFFASHRLLCSVATMSGRSDKGLSGKDLLVFNLIEISRTYISLSPNLTVRSCLSQQESSVFRQRLLCI